MLRGDKQRRAWARTWTPSTWLLALVAMFVFIPHASAVQRTQFDHLTTGFELVGAHRDLSCEYCHQKGVFKGTPRICVGCHTIGSRISATPRPANHISTQAECQFCHSLYNFTPIVRMDHTQARGT